MQEDLEFEASFGCVVGYPSRRQALESTRVAGETLHVISNIALPMRLTCQHNALARERLVED